MEMTDRGKGVCRLLDSFPRVQHNAGVLEKRAVQNKAFILAALSTHIALVKPVGNNESGVDRKLPNGVFCCL